MDKKILLAISGLAVLLLIVGGLVWQTQVAVQPDANVATIDKTVNDASIEPDAKNEPSGTEGDDHELNRLSEDLEAELDYFNSELDQATDLSDDEDLGDLDHDLAGVDNEIFSN